MGRMDGTWMETYIRVLGTVVKDCPIQTHTHSPPYTGGHSEEQAGG